MANPFELSEEDTAQVADMRAQPDREPPKAPEPEAEADEPEAESADTTDADAPQTEGDGKPKRNNMVPHQALHEEREARKALAKELETYKNDKIRFDERVRLINEAQENQRQAAIQPDTMPDPKEAPLDALDWLVRKRQEDETNQREQRQQYEQRTQQQTEYDNFAQAVVGKVQEFIKDQPDYLAAYQHVREQRFEELVDLGYEPKQAAAIVNRNEEEISFNALNRGENPAKKIYDLAKKRGYVPKSEQSDKDAEAADEKVQTISKGVSTNKSLTSAGGAAGNTSMTFDQFMKLSNNEAIEWADKYPVKFKKFMGG